MAAEFWKSKQFKELNREWSEILKEFGFEDAEKEIGEERVLKQTADYAYRRKESVEVVRENKLSYFTLLSQHVSEERQFEDESDRFIMERTAEGWTIREISRGLQALGMTKFNRDTIRYVRRRYEHRWGIKIWDPGEMVSRRKRT